jgi:hypothetical protein
LQHQYKNVGEVSCNQQHAEEPASSPATASNTSKKDHHYTHASNSGEAVPQTLYIFGKNKKNVVVRAKIF